MYILWLQAYFRSLSQVTLKKRANSEFQMLLVDGCNSSSGKQAVPEKKLLILCMTITATENVSSAPCHQCHQQADGFEITPVRLAMSVPIAKIKLFFLPLYLT